MVTRDIKQRYKKRYTYWTILILVVLGLAATATRLLMEEASDIPGGDQIWNITISARVNAADRHAAIHIEPPWYSAHMRIVSQRVRYPGLRLLGTSRKETEKRTLDLETMKAGKSEISAEFLIHKRMIPKKKITLKSFRLGPKMRSEYLQTSADIPLYSVEVNREIDRLSDFVDDKEQLVQRIFERVHQIFIHRDDKLNSVNAALRTNHAGTLGRARTMVALCRAVGIPARIVTGFILEETASAEPYYWVEVYDETRWVPYDPEKGHEGYIPDSYLAFSRGTDTIISVNGKATVTPAYGIGQEYDYSDLEIFKEKRLRDIFDLQRFPPRTRAALALVLLLPLGALVSAVLRMFLGVRSYGTFTPTLLALSAVYAGWLTPMVLLGIVIALALSGRSMLPDKLSRIPRLSIVFIIVAMSLTLGVSLMDYFYNVEGAHVILLPVVILTFVVDRFYSTVDDYGMLVALKRLGWTLVLAFVCFFVVRLENLGYWLLAYPEMHFLTLAAVLLLSTYKGTTLSDLPAFHWMREPRKPASRKNTRDESPDTSTTGQD